MKKKYKNQLSLVKKKKCQEEYISWQLRKGEERLQFVIRDRDRERGGEGREGGREDVHA